MSGSGGAWSGSPTVSMITSFPASRNLSASMWIAQALPLRPATRRVNSEYCTID